MTEVIMPKMGDGMEEGTLLEWLKKDGDKVKSGETIGTIQTDKATLELESPDAGVLTGFLLTGGETVPVGKPIAAILQEGETLPAGWGGKGAPAKPEASAAAPAEAPAPPKPESGAAPQGESTEGSQVQAVPAEAKQPEPEAKKPEPEAPTPTEGGRVIASPLARKIAAEKGIDLHTIQGSGPGGRIVEKDVIQAKALPAAKPEAPAQQAAPSAEDQVIKLNRLRQLTAQRTAQSMQTVPHFYVTVEVDLENIVSLRERFEEDESGKVSVNDFLIKACALALMEVPQVNSSYKSDTEIIQHGVANVAMAVAVEDGLTVAVVKNANALTLRQISAQSHSLATKARENKLHPDEMTGSTFTISNMGMLGVDSFTAIIVPPNAAILAVGSAKKKLVPVGDDEAEIRTKMNITGSFDHRVIDGAVGAKFLNVVRDYLENPTRLLA